MAGDPVPFHPWQHGGIQVDLRTTAESLSVDQEARVRQLINAHPDVQLLLARIVELDAELSELRQTVSDMRDLYEKKGISPKVKDALLGKPLMASPTTTLAEIMTGVRRYVDMSTNLGYAARRNPLGEYIVDLEHPDLREYLPERAAPITLFKEIRRVRATRKPDAADYEFMQWQPRKHRAAFVYAP